MLNPGQLKCRIEVQAKATAQDSFGQQQTIWNTVLSTWAKIGVLTGKEVYALGAGFTAQASHKVSFRFPVVTIVPGSQVLYRGRTFTVQLVQDADESRVQLDLICLENTA